MVATFAYNVALTKDLTDFRMPGSHDAVILSPFHPLAAG
jgi:hypothetical protein